ncbi:hypothetical protein ACPUYX_20935, partial [Desulfosporosinus sp. SYSU MS00001]|uniref:hypothetical protein n=1 Tax=Desulfosporosinus sp. SYSU MS00001 TaxID=3416284 RepID=UPI003CF20054
DDSVSGTLQKGDADYYKIYIPKPGTYEFFLSGINTVNATIYDANNQVVFQGNPGNNQVFTYDGTMQGLYYAVIKDDHNVSNTEDYGFEFYPNGGQNNSIYRFSGND